VIFSVGGDKRSEFQSGEPARAGIGVRSRSDSSEISATAHHQISTGPLVTPYDRKTHRLGEPPSPASSFDLIADLVERQEAVIHFQAQRAEGG